MSKSPSMANNNAVNAYPHLPILSFACIASCWFSSPIHTVPFSHDLPAGAYYNSFGTFCDHVDARWKRLRRTENKPIPYKRNTVGQCNQILRAVVVSHRISKASTGYCRYHFPRMVCLVSRWNSVRFSYIYSLYCILALTKSYTADPLLLTL
ncbi:hypothetical protein EDD85DRAFT_329974 [Armillaria nabsnona]|nr:hypothetical protein EDD85DRAFT_329974 [Armillaria nabsnona]